ncbi:MAG: redoxin domain-containing protein [Pirellulaceae bacterium]
MSHVNKYRSITTIASVVQALTVLVGVSVHPKARGDEPSVTESVELVPRHFLGMVHAPEVHQELKLSAAQVESLEALFRQVDPAWFQSRNFPIAERNAIVGKTEDAVRKWFSDKTSQAQQKRLFQLECYSQGVRMLLREDISRQVGLDAQQRDKLTELARECERLGSERQSRGQADRSTDEIDAKLQAAVKAEQEGYKTILKPQQLQKLSEIIGKPFDTTKLVRTYPMAPEFVPVTNWINSSPLELSALRGKVVLIHFYAFQCHNCHANFEHYRRWWRDWKGKGVAVVGIQTPETPRERDPAAVKTAAVENQLEFPILVDLEMRNWKTWGNTMWPTVYVIDKNGYVRYWWQGELNWKGATGDKTIEDLVEQLLAE